MPQEYEGGYIDARWPNWVVANGYYLTAFGDETDPTHLHSDKTITSWDLRDRKFKLIDDLLSYFSSRVIEHFIKSGRQPVRILDQGGGHGSVAAIEIAGRYPVQVEVINITKAIETNIPQHPNVLTKIGDVRRTGLNDSCIDMTYSFQVYYGLDEEGQLDAITETARILTPGGVAILDEDYLTILHRTDNSAIELEKQLGCRFLFRRKNVTTSRWMGAHRVGSTNEMLVMVKKPVDPKILRWRSLRSKNVRDLINLC